MLVNDVLLALIDDWHYLMGFNSSVRLYVNQPLLEGADLVCERAQAHYLRNVVKLYEGERFAVFNGEDGEWEAQFTKHGKRDAGLIIEKQICAQIYGPDLHYIFAPLKRARLDYMVQKAVELGASRLSPVITQHTNADRVNLERMRANVIEAAEQCGIMQLATVDEPVRLTAFLDGFDKNRQLIYCDEALGGGGPVEALEKIEGKPLSVLIGPEGGFSLEERQILRDTSFVTPISLGPRIMRADTAGVAALSLVNAVIGDWRKDS